MPRKRVLPALESPNAKRHLNNALAADLEALRISAVRSNRNAVQRNVFGGPSSSSPFLTSSLNRRFTVNQSEKTGSRTRYNTSMEFGNEFAESLDEFEAGIYEKEHKSPLIETPDSPSSSSMSFDCGKPGEDIETEAISRMITHEDNSVIIEEMDVPETKENRLIVYRPPVRSSAQSLARINASLPDSHYITRNSKADEWLLKEVNNDRMKRKLALVPWRGDGKKVCDELQRPSRVIPMPWHDHDIAVGNQETIMEIEEIS